MRIGSRFTVACVLLVAFTAGCTCMQKQWGVGALGGAVAGAVGGGIGAGAGANNSGAFDIGNDNADKALAIATGTIGGAMFGALVGHCLWDRQAAVAAPPPPPAPAPAPVQKKIVLRGVNFDFNKANVRPDATAVLKEAATVLKDNATLKVSVEGHTDSKGSDDYNLKLSMQRAVAVKAFLVKEGVAESRLSTRGLGEAQPVASNESEDGRAQNRRVELKVAE